MRKTLVANKTAENIQHCRLPAWRRPCTPSPRPRTGPCLRRSESNPLSRPSPSAAVNLNGGYCPEHGRQRAQGSDTEKLGVQFAIMSAPGVLDIIVAHLRTFNNDVEVCALLYAACHEVAQCITTAHEPQCRCGGLTDEIRSTCILCCWDNISSA